MLIDENVNGRVDAPKEVNEPLMSTNLFDNVVAEYMNMLESSFQLETPGDEERLITPFDGPDGDYVGLELASCGCTATEGRLAWSELTR